MKIIAITTPNASYDKRYLVEISEDEIANVTGHHYFSDIRYKVVIGATIKVGKVWDRLNTILGVAEKLTEAKATITAAANILDPDALKAILTPTPPPEPKQPVAE